MRDSYRKLQNLADRTDPRDPEYQTLHRELAAMRATWPRETETETQPIATQQRTTTTQQRTTADVLSKFENDVNRLWEAATRELTALDHDLTETTRLLGDVLDNI